VVVGDLLVGEGAGGHQSNCTPGELFGVGDDCGD
jgi:hypothetical protein